MFSKKTEPTPPPPPTLEQRVEKCVLKWIADGDFNLLYGSMSQNWRILRVGQYAVVWSPLILSVGPLVSAETAINNHVARGGYSVFRWHFSTNDAPAHSIRSALRAAGVVNPIPIPKYTWVVDCD